MSVYDYDKLIAETRRIAYEFRKTTGQPLPLTAEIARYDARRLLGLSEPLQEESAVDAVLLDGDLVKQRYLVKGRALVANDKSTQRIGQINMDGAWDAILLVLLDETYHALAIYQASRHSINATLTDHKPNKRGAMTVAKFKAIADCVWQAPEVVKDDK